MSEAFIIDITFIFYGTVKGIVLYEQFLKYWITDNKHNDLPVPIDDFNHKFLV